MPKFTLFTEVLNGEPLLSYWLKYHRRLFDHGVIVFYPSEDNSRDIIDEICPDWDVVEPLHCPYYSCAGADKEVMMQEKKYKGWKMALNVTEFAVTQSLAEVVENVSRETKCILPVDAAVMVDTPDTVDYKLDPTIPLLFQKHHGLYSDDYPLWKCRHSRQLHRGVHGEYDVGRHNSGVKPKAKSPLLYVAWFVWSPYKYIRERKLVVQNQLSDVDISVKRGWQHMVTPQIQDRRFKRVSKVSYDLYKEAGYKTAVGGSAPKR